MRAVLFLLAVAMVGCDRPRSGVGTSSPSDTSSAPTRSLVHSGQPDFAEMVRALEKDPKDAKYKNQFLSIDMEVDEIKEVQKDHYLVTGRVDNVTVQATFLVRRTCGPICK